MLVLQSGTACSGPGNTSPMEMIAVDRFQIKSFVLIQWTTTNGHHVIAAFTVTDFHIAY